jgi:hypothetical protein
VIGKASPAQGRNFMEEKKKTLEASSDYKKGEKKKSHLNKIKIQ